MALQPEGENNLAGVWKISERSSETVVIRKPEDLAEYAFAVSDIDLESTWPGEGPQRYQQALEAYRATGWKGQEVVIVDF